MPHFLPHLRYSYISNVDNDRPPVLLLDKSKNCCNYMMVWFGGVTDGSYNSNGPGCRRDMGV